MGGQDIVQKQDPTPIVAQQQVTGYNDQQTPSTAAPINPKVPAHPWIGQRFIGGGGPRKFYGEY